MELPICNIILLYNLGNKSQLGSNDFAVLHICTVSGVLLLHTTPSQMGRHKMGAVKTVKHLR